MNLLPKFSDNTDQQRRQNETRTLMQREAKIGGELFGPVPKGHSRQFFCLDERTWIWSETWKDAKGQQQSVTTTYDVRSNGIVKSQNGTNHQYVSLEEGRNLYKAVELYEQRVDADFDQISHATS